MIFPIPSSFQSLSRIREGPILFAEALTLFIHYLVNIILLIGIVSLLVGLGMKVFAFEGFNWISVGPRGFLRLADTCFLLAIASSVREIIREKIKKE